MKKLHLLVLGLAITFMFAACSDDDDAKTLRYSSTSTEFKVWVGSSEGGKEISSKIKPSDILDDIYMIQIKEFEEMIKSITITFINDSQLSASYLGQTAIMKYKFENGALSTYDSEDDDWYIIGYGNKDNITTKSGILGWFHENGRGFDQTEKDNYTLEDGLSRLDISSLSEMTKTTDTIAIYNVNMIMK